jgi:alpha-L-rhamnosidase
MRRHLLVLTAVLLAAQSSVAALLPQHLRCEYLANPLGVDSVRPRLGWILEARPAGLKNLKQAAYRILVSSSAEKLAAGSGDLWDSGRVTSHQQNLIEYAGKPLGDGAPCHWKVRVWDGDGKPSPWSEPARWTMGILQRSRWQAKWIFDPAVVVPANADEEARRTAHNGYRSSSLSRPEEEKWLALDLGAPKTIDAIRLWPAQFDAGGPAYHFPLRFRIEAGSRADFSDAATVVDQTSSDQPAPAPGTPAEFKFAPATAQYVKLTATKLRRENEVIYCVALAEMEALSGGVNVARGSKVTARDSTNAAGWSRENLVDGRTARAQGEPVIQPVSVFRKSFRIDAGVRRATAYATARGVYELRLNGKRVDNRVLAPEFTDYLKRIQYQTYDVTALLRAGENVLGATLAAGWYSGRVGLFKRHMYGVQPQFLARLEIELADGRTAAIITDESWGKHPDPPLRSSDILDGEIYDARKETAGWDAPGFDGRAWKPVSADANLGDAVLSAQPNEPIQPVLELKPVSVSEPAPGVYIFDLGQNMAGWCRLRVRGVPGRPVRVRYGEALRDDGLLYTANLRQADQTEIYIPRSSAAALFEPSYTYHGFRYMEVSGLTGKPSLSDATGVVIYSASPAAGELETSSPMLNRLLANVLWTQRANMYSVPTDCPQRDERLGWMGDIQAFAQTAIFNMDMAGFLTKWLRDVRDDQAPDGRFPNFAPNPETASGALRSFGAPAWADAGVIVPWRMYQNYGDRRLLAEHFGAARRWVDYVHAHNPNLLWEKNRHADYNDWLNADTIIQEGWPRQGGEVPKPIFGTAFWAHSTDLVARMAGVLGRAEDAARYGKLFEGIKAAFNRAYVKADGRIESDTQTAYALALHFNLLPEALRPAAARYMVEGSARYGGHLSTGIQGTHRLMLELAREGRTEEAYRYLLLRSFPSWGFMIENGATTIWERWDGYVKGRGFQGPGMNSFNHWAFGAVGEWMWRVILGLNPDDAAPGFAHFILRPQPGGGLTSASGTYNSIRGPIRVAWRIENGSLALNVSVPPNTTATVHMPSPGASPVRIGSGDYTFRGRLP